MRRSAKSHAALFGYAVAAACAFACLLAAILVVLSLAASVAFDLQFDRSDCARVDGEVPSRDVCSGDLVFRSGIRTPTLLVALIVFLGAFLVASHRLVIMKRRPALLPDKVEDAPSGLADKQGL